MTLTNTRTGHRSALVCDLHAARPLPSRPWLLHESISPRLWLTRRLCHQPRDKPSIWRGTRPLDDRAMVLCGLETLSNSRTRSRTGHAHERHVTRTPPPHAHLSPHPTVHLGRPPVPICTRQTRQRTPRRNKPRHAHPPTYNPRHRAHPALMARRPQPNPPPQRRLYHARRSRIL